MKIFILLCFTNVEQFVSIPMLMLLNNKIQMYSFMQNINLSELMLCFLNSCIDLVSFNDF